MILSKLPLIIDYGFLFYMRDKVNKVERKRLIEEEKLHSGKSTLIRCLHFDVAVFFGLFWREWSDRFDRNIVCSVASSLRSKHSILACMWTRNIWLGLSCNYPCYRPLIPEHAHSHSRGFWSSRPAISETWLINWGRVGCKEGLQLEDGKGGHIFNSSELYKVMVPFFISLRSKIE